MVRYRNMTLTFANEKDVMRAETLMWRGHTFDGGCSGLKEMNAIKMAKLITDKQKILGRLEAMAAVHGRTSILWPFIEKAVELWPNSEFSSAYRNGLSNGRYSMSPSGGGGYQIKLANIIYNVAFSVGRNSNQIEFDYNGSTRKATIR
jgi:hypothetical protein